MRKIAICITLLLLAIVGIDSSFASSWGDVTDTSFEIPVQDFTFGGTQFLGEGKGTTEVVGSVLSTTLEKLIVIFGALAAFIMTIGAGYMIIYHGQDDLLSRWKSIFMAGVIALVIALSAGIIVRLFTYILY